LQALPFLPRAGPSCPRRRLPAPTTERYFGQVARKLEAPRGLHSGGRALYHGVTDIYDLGPHELSILRDACRINDIQDGFWRKILAGDEDAVTEWRLLAEQKRRMLVALRLPEEPGGTRPQTRPARGPYGHPHLVKDVGV
jgi:hypothetical protein